jgi:hypothetical protein
MGTLGALGMALALAFAPVAAATVTPIDPTTHFEHTFTYTGAEQDQVIAPGVRSAQVEAIGGRGASKSGKPGGFAAKVTGPVDVEGLNYLYVLVGGNASGEVGGFNGGGYGGNPSGTGAPVGGGGGGASDVRSQISFLGQVSLESRLLVAAGGGGAGALANSASKANAKGGNAGKEGGRAESLGGTANTIGAGGFGGHPGGESAGGAGGEGGYLYGGPGFGDNGEDGHAGSLGGGGQGGQGAFDHPPGWGGGGGGGLYGGGGGGGGSDYTGGETAVNSGGGGGGGGSSLVPTGGTFAIDENSSSSPQVTVKWSIPGTWMLGPDEYTNHAEPPLGLHSEEPGAEFECRVDSEEESAWEPCEPEPSLDLADGHHRVEARAVNAEGNFDPTPAAVEFTVDTTAPVVTSLNGPSVAEPTTDPQPTFTFTASDLAPVHFDCGFDVPLGECSGEGSARPPQPLAPGEHTFTLVPIDAAGNVGAAVVRTFVVGPAPAQSSPGGGSKPFAPTISLGKVKVNAKKGTATVLATVDGPGELRLTGSKVKSATVKASGSGVVAIPVAASGKALKRLRSKKAVSVSITVAFTAATGGTATASKTVRLRLGQAHRHRHR